LNKFFFNPRQKHWPIFKIFWSWQTLRFFFQIWIFFIDLEFFFGGWQVMRLRGRCDVWQEFKK